MESVLIAAAGIAASPTIWNIIARNEYYNHTMERLFGGKYPGCYALAAWIFGSSFYKDYLFYASVDDTAAWTIVASASQAEVLYAVGTVMLAVGAVLVLSAFARLGITGTYLGDYFGILMEKKVEGFPFNILENPMYVGATLNFLGYALQRNNLPGVALSAWVYLVYDIATRFFENPFTNAIYAKREKERAAAALKKK